MRNAEEQQLAYAAKTNASVRKVIAERQDLRDENARLRLALSDAIRLARSKARTSEVQHRLTELERTVTR